MTGSGGISSMQTGTVAGLPATAPSGVNGNAGVTIAVGSGPNDAGAPNIELVTRNTIANDALNPAPLIGRDSRDRSPVLPTGQVYRGGFPETAPAPLGGNSRTRNRRISSQGPFDSADPAVSCTASPLVRCVGGVNQVARGSVAVSFPGCSVAGAPGRPAGTCTSCRSFIARHRRRERAACARNPQIFFPKSFSPCVIGLCALATLHFFGWGMPIFAKGRIL